MTVKQFLCLVYVVGLMYLERQKKIIVQVACTVRYFLSISHYKLLWAVTPTDARPIIYKKTHHNNALDKGRNSLMIKRQMPTKASKLFCNSLIVHNFEPIDL